MINIWSMHGLDGLSKGTAVEFSAKGTGARGGITGNAICSEWTKADIFERQSHERMAAL